MAFRVYPTVERETMTVEICNSSGKRVAVEELFYGYIELPNEIHETEVVYATRDYSFKKITKGKVARRAYIYKADFLHPQTSELLTVVWSQVDNTYNGTTYQPLVEIRYDRQHRKTVVELPMPDNMSLMRLINMPEDIQQFVEGYNMVEYKHSLNNYVTKVSGTAEYVKTPEGEFIKVIDIPCKWYAVTKNETFLAEGVIAYTENEWYDEIKPKQPEGWYEATYDVYADGRNLPLYLNGIEWKPQEGIAPDKMDIIPLPVIEVAAYRRQSAYTRYPYYYNPETVKIVECTSDDYDYYHPKPKQKPVLIKKEKVVYSSNNSNDSNSPFTILAKLKK